MSLGWAEHQVLGTQVLPHLVCVALAPRHHSCFKKHLYVFRAHCRPGARCLQVRA